ncbi:unnamed protein product [Phytomonas sp. Hart1]|nr:unnamed protein product [Phytomonas sp. Hart1]|eukprot:CCW66869.1 unnamed protein product [Phytomonas sp. isolate Hart1]
MIITPYTTKTNWDCEGYCYRSCRLLSIEKVCAGTSSYLKENNTPKLFKKHFGNFASVIKKRSKMEKILSNIFKKVYQPF